MQASAVAARGLSSCGAWTQLLSSICSLPGPGIRPVSPVLAGVFLTTGPAGKNLSAILLENKKQKNHLGETKYYDT